MEKVLLGYHCTVTGIRKASRLQTLFRENGYLSRVEEIIERIMDETPKGYNCYWTQMQEMRLFFGWVVLLVGTMARPKPI